MAARDSGLTQPIFQDVDVDTPAPPSLLAAVSERRGSLTGTGRDVLEVEDAMDRLGGIGRYQIIHFAACGVFWFAQPGVLFSLFANGPCRRAGDVCALAPDYEPPEPPGTALEVVGSTLCCSAYDSSPVVGGAADGCNMDVDTGVGTCTAQSTDYWSTCRSVSCQFDLGIWNGGLEGDTFDPTRQQSLGREFFDSMFFLGWMWSVPVWGGLSDKLGRRVALFLALTFLHIGQLTSALAPNFAVYALARHFVGIGVGCTSLTSFVIGTEYAPRSRATAIKAGWSYWSGVGGIVMSLVARALYYNLSFYNWRWLTILMSLPIFIWTFFAFFLIEESPRWLLVNRGVEAANAVLAKVARRNGTQHLLKTFELRQPVSAVGGGGGDAEAAAAKPFEQVGQRAGKDRDSLKDLFCGPAAISVRVVVALVLWFSIAFSYYGLILRATTVPSLFDVFYTNAVATSVELPAMLLNIVAIDIFGRKRTTLALFLMLAVGSYSVIAVTLLPEGAQDSYVLTLNFFGRAVSSAGFSAVYLWSSELFPTSLRHSAMGFGSMSARIGSVIAPYAARIGDVLTFLPEEARADVPLLLFGTSAIISGTLGMLLLPETLGLATPETVADVIAQARTQVHKACSCCRRRRVPAGRQ